MRLRVKVLILSICVGVWWVKVRFWYFLIIEVTLIKIITFRVTLTFSNIKIGNSLRSWVHFLIKSTFFDHIILSKNLTHPLKRSSSSQHTHFFTDFLIFCFFGSFYLFLKRKKHSLIKNQPHFLNAPSKTSSPTPGNTTPLLITKVLYNSLKNIYTSLKKVIEFVRE